MIPAGPSQTGGAVAEDAAPPLFPPLWLTVAVAWGGRDWPVRLCFNEAGEVRDVRAIDMPDGTDQWTEVAEACAGLSELIGDDVRPMTVLALAILFGLLAAGFMSALVDMVARVERECAGAVRAAYAARANANRVRGS